MSKKQAFVTVFCFPPICGREGAGVEFWYDRGGGGKGGIGAQCPVGKPKKKKKAESGLGKPWGGRVSAGIAVAKNPRDP